MKRLSLIALSLALWSLAASAPAQNQPSIAPMKTVSALPSKFGLLQAPIDLSHLVRPIGPMAPAPPSWDWRSHAVVTAVNDLTLK